MTRLFQGFVQQNASGNTVNGYFPSLLFKKLKLVGTSLYKIRNSDTRQWDPSAQHKYVTCFTFLNLFKNIYNIALGIIIKKIYKHESVPRNTILTRRHFSCL